MFKEEAEINQEMVTVPKDDAPTIGDGSSQYSKLRKILIFGGTPNIPGLNADPHSDIRGKEEGEIVENNNNFTGLKTRDVDHTGVKLLYDLEVEIFSRFSCFEYWKLNFLNKQFSKLLQSGEIFKVRRERGLMKPYVFMLTSSDTHWRMFDSAFTNSRNLPEVPSDACFHYGDKETISAGTQLIVIGSDVEDILVWRYELEMHKWSKGPAMNIPRTMYGSASHGTDTFFAGGIKKDEKGIYKVLNVVEKYNADTKTWTMISGMHKCRKFSSGCFLRGKFFVLGGRDEKDAYLKCGESYDGITNTWQLIPDMLKDITFVSPQSPPLIAVVKDNLYLLDIASKAVLVYDINGNVWKTIGGVPVKTDVALGWGVAFKSVGDRLLVIGGSSTQSWKETMSVYTCCPSPNVEPLLWEESIYCCHGVNLSHFIHNCCVMFA